jgi:hypothetical protein
MVIQRTVISFEQFVQDFDSLFRHRVFRLEALDWYDAPNEHEPYARFLAGQPADLAWREPWKRLVRDVRASRRIMERVHIVTEPVSDYVRFELLHVYPANVEAGEDVRILARQPAEGAGVTFRDFWLFDDSLAALLGYDDDGRVQSVQTTDSPLELERMRKERADAFTLAVPLAQYVAEHDITEGKQAA